MWIDWRGVKVACAYFVPITSPFEKRNEKRMIELQQRTLEQKGRVKILANANGWIGQAPSIITKPETGFERETLTFERKSEKKEITAMNRKDMIILNGIRSVAQ